MAVGTMTRPHQAHPLTHQPKALFLAAQMLLKLAPQKAPPPRGLESAEEQVQERPQEAVPSAPLLAMAGQCLGDLQAWAVARAQASKVHLDLAMGSQAMEEHQPVFLLGMATPLLQVMAQVLETVTAQRVHILAVLPQGVSPLEAPSLATAE